LERACYLRASRPKARHQLADFCSAPLAGCYAAVDSENQVIGIVSIGDLVKSKISDQDFVIDQLERYISG